MRIGLVWEPETAGGYYRALGPGEALERRGHQIALAPARDGAADAAAFRDCDVVVVYRRYDGHTREVVRQLKRRGVRVVYDNDDDFLSIPEEHPHYERLGGEHGRRLFRQTVEMARSSDLMLATTDPVAERYRAEGVSRVEVVPNYLRIGAQRPPVEHGGIVIGWIAGLEHAADARRIGVVDALAEVIARHPDVSVESVGVDLGLGERYRHEALLPFEELPTRIAGYDIGLAPLADLPFNRARSDIKLKEYAACGVPWLASPVGPYAGLGEAEGGRLVDDDGWARALDRLVRKHRERRRLAKAARAWAQRSSIDRHARRYEQLFHALLDYPRAANQ